MDDPDYLSTADALSTVSDSGTSGAMLSDFQSMLEAALRGDYTATQFQVRPYHAGRTGNAGQQMPQPVKHCIYICSYLIFFW